MKQYVVASRTFGASSVRLIFVNILPNCLAPIIIQATLGFSDGILNAAALGFLGLGAQPPTPEWGTMLADSRAFIESAPWLVTLPGVCIILVVLGFNLLGDGLRDAFDPRLRK
jgi:ABC-type dipeptide/oligopeptide/nickel transport system permease subunit